MTPTPGTVTSVGISAPSIFSVSGSPVTGSGTLTLALSTQSAGLVFAGPSSGLAGAPTFRALVASDIPTLNQNTTGTAANVTGTVAIANGGTGATTQQGAMNALAGTQSAGTYLRSDGTNTTLSSIQASDVPTLNQNTTGTASNVTGTVAIAHGGTGQTTQQAAINALAGTQSAGKYLRSDGTNTTLSSIQAGDVPTLNQNTTGTAANVTGTVAITNGGTGQTTQQAALNALAGTQSAGKYLRSDGTNTTLSSIQASDVPAINLATSGSGGVTGNLPTANLNGGTGASSSTFWRGDGTWAAPSATPYKVPTIQKFTSGTGTYTTPAGALYIRVRMVGGGGGGAGSGTANGSTPTAGGNTTFGTSLLAANGGGVNANIGAAGGSGGTASLGTGPIGIAISGGTGAGGFGNLATGAAAVAGGSGGVSPFGGAGTSGCSPLTGGAAVANSGSGGAGGSISATASGYSGPGGGAGGFVDAIITNPAASYAYSIGTGGSAGGAGTNGSVGGAGGSGIIIVEEHYQ
jgi:hypothetical protein